MNCLTLKRRGIVYLVVMLLGAILCVGSGSAGAKGLDEWQWRNLLPQGCILHDVCYANGAYVAVGECGAIISSTDKITWMKQVTNTVYNLRAIVYGNGIYVAVGENGTILTSSDMKSWVVQNSGTTVNLRGIVFGNGTFIVLGADGLVLTSSNGSSWQQKTNLGIYMLDAVWAQDKFIAVGDNGTIMTSTNGSTWTQRTSGTPRDLYSITYGANGFVAVGRMGWVTTSADGINWTARQLDSELIYGVAYGLGKYTAVALAAVFTSSNGSNWTKTALNADWDPKAVVGGANSFIAVGNWGLVICSTNGVDWTSLSSTCTYSELNSVAYAGNKFVAVGESGAVVYSLNGQSWTSANSNCSTTLKMIASNGQKCVAVGGSGTIISSTDGINWSTCSSNTASSLKAVCTDQQGRFIAVGTNGCVLFSNDGASWTVCSSGTSNSLYGVAYGNGRYVAVGRDGTVVTSSDGTAWQLGSSGTTQDLDSVAYGNASFIALGSGNCFLSDDGQTWITSSIPSSSTYITYANGTFMLVGLGSSVYTSVEGGNWQSWLPYNANLALYGEAYGAGSFIVVGDNGAILQSGIYGSNPQVSSTTPVDGGIDIAADCSLYAVFNSAVTAQNLSLITITDSQGINLSGVTAGISSDGLTVTISHPVLPSGESYTVTIPAGTVKDQITGLDNQEASWWFMTKASFPLELAYKMPAENQSEVNIDCPVEVVFTSAIALLNPSGPTITDSQGLRVNGVYAAVDSDEMTLRINHDALKNGETYTVTIPAGTVSGKNGEECSQAISWQFTTRQVVPLEHAYTIPADGQNEVGSASSIEVVFTSPIIMQAPGGITITDSWGNLLEGVSAEIGSDEMTLQINHAALINGESYTVTIPAGTVQGKDGGQDNQVISWQFTTEQAIPLEYAYTMPSDGQSDVRVDSAIEIVFTSEVEIYEPDAIYIQNSHGKLAEDVTAEIDSDAMTLKIKHAVFAESESYMVVIPAGTIRARSGGAENQDINWTFTTCGSGPDESNFEEWYGAPSTVAKTKIWTVKFNHTVDPDTVNDSNIYVLNSRQQKVAVNLSVGGDGRSVLVGLGGESSLSGDYSLYITTGVRPVYGTGLQKGVVLRYTVL